MVSRRRNPLIWAVVALAVFITALWQQRAQHDSAPPTVAASAPVTSPAKSAREATPRQGAMPNLSAVPEDERDQLESTLALIARGGPFPHAKDGSVFQNREGLLPPQAQGYYREYTVPTPGANTRGARRVVQGRGGETWYTRDHYNSFVRIDE